MPHRILVRACVGVMAISAMTCTPKPVQVVPQLGDVIVLAPDPDDKTVGHVTVSDQSGMVELTRAWEATRVDKKSAPSAPAAIDQAQIDGMRDLLAALPPGARHFTLYFQFASDELTIDSQAVTVQILEAVRTRANPDVIVVGHTDTTGTPASNYELGLQRAAIVRNMLVAAGLDAAAVAVTSHGERDLLIATPDETYEPRNRRVEIDIQ